MLVDQGLELLSQEAAWDLLSGEEVGRVGITLGGLPVILPVNFAVIDGGIVFRTAAGSKLTAAAAGAMVAFQVDDHDRESRSGWSVLVIGRSEVVHDLDVTAKAVAAKLEPFADGSRANLVRIQPELVSGRRLFHGTPPPSEPVTRNDVVYLTDSVDQSFDDVCQTLTDASDTPGAVVAVSRSLATLDLDRGAASGRTELRILPIHGGRDSLTELMLISSPQECSPATHAEHVALARARLDRVLKSVRDAAALEHDGPG